MQTIEWVLIGSLVANAALAFTVAWFVVGALHRRKPK